MLEFFSPQNLNAFWARLTSGHAFAATALVVSILLLTRMVVLRIAYRNIEDKFVRMRYKRTVSYISFFIGLFLLLPIWLPSIRNVATFLGIFGAGFLIVTRDLWVCVVGWAYIMIRRPFVIGDRVQIGNVAGDVIDIRLMETSIMEVSSAEGGQTTGRVVFFPNAKIFTESFATTGAHVGHVFQELQVSLTATSDWKSAAELLEKCAKKQYETARAAKEQLQTGDAELDMISFYRDPRVLTQMVGNHIVLKLQYMAPTGQGVNMQDRIWREFLTLTAKKPRIRFAEK
ncbi:mechanosensitive ion channel family protein [Turneriella parva]|uniref:MscS Mechanosensitive ion channel n=1 Tax=Turneriella parva (strain ATCC BAA-1111 / DSM 21527 / NCTC 11395 / H) TaxID=869212 RepID=I4B1C8_TURPD|nr:mechanosensitive ion channel family protein [Turneriella parva]AFM11085.1 MscS Mechanosensitive ion channel [Turneriella parva DSM 21527]